MSLVFSNRTHWSLRHEVTVARHWYLLYRRLCGRLLVVVRLGNLGSSVQRTFNRRGLLETMVMEASRGMDSVSVQRLVDHGFPNHGFENSIIDRLIDCLHRLINCIIRRINCINRLINGINRLSNTMN